MKKIILLLVFSVLFLHRQANSQISLIPFSSGFSSPIDIKNCGDERLFIVEQSGYIRIVDTLGVHYPNPFLDIHTRVNAGGERGLLGLAFDPHYKDNGFFYVYYTELTHGDVRISRFSVSDTNPDSAVAASEDFVITIWHPYSNHNGGHLAFRPNDGYLYIGTGDGGSGGDPGNRAQNVDSLLGKILRLDVSDTSVAYTIPSDNPLVGTAGRGEIWNIGQRNPWRWSFDRMNSDLWIGDVGQNAWEEVDYQPTTKHGGNYGWRCYEGNGHPYNTAGCQPANTYDAPVYEYANNGAAIVGGYRYRGAKYANMYGKYFFTDEFTSTYQFRTLESNGAGGWTATLLGSLGRSTVVAFGEDRWGEIYCADYNNGGIYRFVGTTCSPVASISDNDTIYVCDTINPFVLRTPEGNGFHYAWYQDGNAVSNSDNDTLMITQGGSYYVIASDSSNCSATSLPVLVIYAGLPAVSISGLDTFYCVYNQQDTMTGTPIGGQFSGPGCTGPANRYFDPALAGTGDHIITYTYTNFTSGCVNSTTTTTHVDLCTSIPQQSFIPRFNLYPNPNTGIFTIDFYLDKSKPLNLGVTDVTGRTVYNETIHAEAGVQSYTLKLAQLAKGIYNLKVSGEEGMVTKRFVIE
ncbi:hypothetical protein BH11BAC1_BH11BAC1_01380 [soil metagenome]